MSAKDLLKDVITEANSEKALLEDEYWSLSPGVQEWDEWAIRMKEKIDNLGDAIKYLHQADELMED